MRVQRVALIRVVATAAAVAIGAISQTPMFTITGAQSSNFGIAVGGGRDLNGDGIPDFVVAATGDASGAGTVSIYSGFDESLIHLETGATSGDALGYSLAIIGDASGDGIADLVIGAPVGHAPGGGQPGYARYVLGASFIHGDLYGPPLPPLASPDFRLGYAVNVAAAGDVNGDGLADAIVARPGRCQIGSYTSPGCVLITPGYSYLGDATVFAGGSGAVLHQVGGPAAFSYPQVVAGLGDVDGDGKSDFALVSGGEFQTASCSSVCPPQLTRLSVRSGLTGAEIWGFTGAIAADTTIARLGDLNGDGRSELCWRTYSSGYAITTILSGLDGSSLHGRSEQLGIIIPANVVRVVSCADLGDVDGDGISDYALGDTLNFPLFTNVNRVRVCSGATHAVLYQIDGPYASSFGAAVSAVGDLNGDGRPDFIVGAPIAGFAQVFSGATATLASAVTVPAGCAAGGPQLLLTSTAPIIGGTALINLTGAPYPSSGSLLLSTVPAGPTIVPGGASYATPCPILIDFATVIAFAPIAPTPAGTWFVTAPVPSVPSLMSLPFALQAAIWPASGGFAASNALNGVLGF